MRFVFGEQPLCSRSNVINVEAPDLTAALQKLRQDLKLRVQDIGSGYYLLEYVKYAVYFTQEHLAEFHICLNWPNSPEEDLAEHDSNGTA